MRWIYYFVFQATKINQKSWWSQNYCISEPTPISFSGALKLVIISGRLQLHRSQNPIFRHSIQQKFFNDVFWEIPTESFFFFMIFWVG